jgi:hypothetical protein
MKPADFLITLAIGTAIFNIALPEGTLMSAPLAAQEQQTGDVAYITGGIGESEAEMMRGIAKDYPLEIAFVQKLKQHEEFIASVKVQIQDSSKNMVLDVVTDGPYLFANMPQGIYLIIAEHNGDTKQQWVRVNIKKHQKIVFWWPVLEPPHEADPEEDTLQ